jgi:acylphosphatase
MARALGVRGVARNLLDGTVEIVAEGTQSSIQSLIEWAHKGPPEARVDEVRAEWTDATAEFRGFEIR